jgi:hypothetical protein
LLCAVRGVFLGWEGPHLRRATMARPIRPGNYRRHFSSAAAKAAPPRPAKKLQRFARELHSQWRPADGEKECASFNITEA